MIGKAAIFLKHKAKEFGKWAITKPTVKKIRTGDPMIKTDAYDYNQIIKDPAKKFKSKFKYKTRRELLKKKIILVYKWQEVGTKLHHLEKQDMLLVL